MYMVSNFGRVKSLPRTAWSTRGSGFWFTTKGTMLKPTMMGCDVRYPYVRIKTPKVNKPMPIHRFVAEEFIGEIPKGMLINHKDGNTLNNHVENLEIVTPQENIIHSRKVLKTPKGYSTSKIQVLDIETNEIKIYNNGVEAAKELGCCSENVRCYTRGVWKGLYKGKYKIEDVDKLEKISIV